MASIDFEQDLSGFGILSDLRKIFPELMAQTLGHVGSIGKKKLKQSFLSGQELNLSAFPKDSRGRRTIQYSVGKNASSVLISSYPLNLFERGRKLRGGKTEPGKKIMKTKFKQAMLSDLQSILNDFDNKFLQKKIDGIK